MTSTPGANHIPSLDGIRAISVLLVFFAHAGLDHWIPGGFGVTVFFFLSGFLITTLMRREFERHGSINLMHFWLRRALRILPAFYLVLGTATAVTWFLGAPDAISWPAVAAQALHVSNVWQILHGNAGQAAGTVVYWSLAVEEHFYLLFPWVFLLLARTHHRAATKAGILWGLCALILLWRLYLVLIQQVPLDRTYMGSDTRVDSILYGCALALWRNPALDRPKDQEPQARLGLLLGATAVLLATFLVRSPVFRETLRYSLQGLALTVIFTEAVTNPRLLPFRLLNSRPFVFLGELSYSFYLVHFVILFLVWNSLPAIGAPAQTVVAFLATLGISWGICRFIERPCARLRHRLSD